MKTVTIEDILSFGPCWENARERMEKIAQKYNQQEWSAVDVLRLPEALVSNADKLWLVLREELVDVPVLHEFACRCAEHVLSKIDNPDPRSVAAVEAKRAWLRGEISDDELDNAHDAAGAAHYAAARVAKSACHAAYSAYRAADDAAYWAASDAADCAAKAANDKGTERTWQVAELIKMLEE